MYNDSPFLSPALQPTGLGMNFQRGSKLNYYKLLTGLRSALTLAASAFLLAPSHGREQISQVT